MIHKKRRVMVYEKRVMDKIIVLQGKEEKNTN
jgi:hypothetical protein